MPRAGGSPAALGAFAVTAAVALGLLVPGASGLKTVTVPARVEPVPWAPLDAYTRAGEREPAVVGRTLRLGSEGGYCVGGPKPRIGGVRVIERPRTAERPFRSAVITVFKEWPEHLEGVAPVKPSGPQYGSVAIASCAGLGGTLMRRIRLKRPVGDLILFDGSYPTPRRVWPKPDRVAAAISNPGAGEKRVGSRAG